MGLPVQWGGHASFIVVRGDSMLPTYVNGDLVIVRESDNYRIGDVVAYRVPEFDLGAGTVILHRIVDDRGDGGFVLKGDNNDDLDTWQPGKDDTVGRAAMSVPRLGRVLAFMRSPGLLASLGFSVTFAVLVTSPKPRRGAHLASKNRSLWKSRRLRTR